MNTLQRAMTQVADDDVVAIETIGRQAVQAALAHDARTDFARQLDRSQELEAQRQRDLDAALADAVEVVARQRLRIGRRVCSVSDARTVRQIHELLRNLSAASESDPSFP